MDGSYTNRTVLTNLAERTVLIGRIRKDANLFALPPEEGVRRGRRRYYGQSLPTPDEIRRDPAVPWKTVTAYAAGTLHSFRIKTMEPVRWKAGGNTTLKLMVIAPLGYRLTQGSRLNYRNPAYLICTDPTISDQMMLQSFVWRWEIEVNFRDEKTLIGLGDAQVRTPQAVETMTALLVIAYALLLLAVHRIHGTHCPLPMPKWRAHRSGSRVSTAQSISLLRADLWGTALGIKKRDFVDDRGRTTKSIKITDPLSSAVIFASK